MFVRHRLFSLLTLILIVSLLLFAMPIHAQDVTPEPGATVVMDATAVPPVVVTPPVVEQPPATFINAENGISVSTLAYGVIIALLSGGTLAVIISRFGSNKANLDALEKLYQSASPETQQLIRERFVELEGIVKRLLDIADKATDGLPNDTPPPPASPNPF